MSEPSTRILYVHHNADLYGASRSLVRLLKHLDRKRFLPLVVLSEDGPLRPAIEALGIKVIIHDNLSVIRRPAFRFWRIILFVLQIPISVFFLWRLIRRHQIDLVHTNSGIIISPGVAAKLAGVPHIWHIRDWFQEFKAVWSVYSRYIVWSSRKVIAVSEAIAQQFRRRERIVVVHNG